MIFVMLTLTLSANDEISTRQALIGRDVRALGHRFDTPLANRLPLIVWVSRSNILHSGIFLLFVFRFLIPMQLSEFELRIFAEADDLRADWALYCILIKKTLNEAFFDAGYLDQVLNASGAKTVL